MLLKHFDVIYTITLTTFIGYNLAENTMLSNENKNGKTLARMERSCVNPIHFGEFQQIGYAIWQKY